MKKLTYISFLILVPLQVWSAKLPGIDNGILDLRGVDLSAHNKPLALSGEWKFYWMRYIDPVERPDSSYIMVQVPDDWMNYSIDNENLSSFGYASYHLRIVVDKQDNTVFGMKIPAVNSAYTLFVNGKAISSAGILGQSAEETSSHFKPKTVYFNHQRGIIDLVFHVANFDLIRSGLREPPYFGTSQAITGTRERLLTLEFFIFGAIMIIAFQYLIIYLNKKRELVHLFFSLTCLSVGLRTLFMGERYFMYIFDDLPIKVMIFFTTGSIYLICAFFILFVKELFVIKAAVSLTLIKFLIPLLLFQFVVVLFGSPATGEKMIGFMQLSALASLLFTLFLIFKAVREKFEGVSLILIGFTVIFAAGINDILFDRRLLSLPLNVLPLSIFFFLFTQSVLLSKRSAAAQKNIEKLSEDIKNTNTALARFVPQEFLFHLRKSAITEIDLGDYTEKNMSVLFADIRRFTTMSEHAPSREIFLFLNNYLQFTAPAIINNHGFIDKYIGDAVMALFAEAPDYAIKAAIEMQQHLTDFNNTMLKGAEQPVAIGIGVQYGNLMLGTIGSIERMDTTVISDSVNMASRMENLTKLYGASIITSIDTITKCTDPSKFNFRALDTVQIRGKTRPVELVEVLNGLDNKDFQMKCSTKGTFEQGVYAYKQGALSDAREHFFQVLQISPDDKAAVYLLARCEKYLAKGVDKDFTGIQVFHS